MTPNAYHAIAFTPEVKALQENGGSRASYDRQGPRAGGNACLGEAEIAFISERDGFYIASVSQSGWPYVQFRGGPPGFVHATPDDIAWADFRGNQQFQTAGYVLGESRVSLFFMDYAGKRRLKVYGRLVFCAAADCAETVRQLTPPDYPARIDRIATVCVSAWDRNCPQHIPDRLTSQEWRARQPASLRP